MIYHILVTKIRFTVRFTATNQKGSADEGSTMCGTWGGNLSAGLQESCGEIPC
jgi:hypothetical protein